VAALAFADGCGDDDERAADAPPAARPPDVPVERLREGGYVVVFRHAATDTGWTPRTISATAPGSGT
jgi:hypothetical protein